MYWSLLVCFLPNCLLSVVIHKRLNSVSWDSYAACSDPEPWELPAGAHAPNALYRTPKNRGRLAFGQSLRPQRMHCSTKTSQDLFSSPIVSQLVFSTTPNRAIFVFASTGRSWGKSFGKSQSQRYPHAQVAR